jgi:hypothetical protein
MNLFQHINMADAYSQSFWQWSTPTLISAQRNYKQKKNFYFFIVPYSVFSLSSGLFPHNYHRDNKTLKKCEWHLDIRIQAHMSGTWSFLAKNYPPIVNACKYNSQHESVTEVFVELWTKYLCRSYYRLTQNKELFQWHAGLTHAQLNCA